MRQGSRSVLRASLFLCFDRQISVYIREVLFHSASLLAVSILHRAHHQASVRSSRSALVLASSAVRAQAAHFLRFFSATLALGPCRPSCLDSFFLPHLIWCMLLICFCLAPRIHASSEQSALNTDFPSCFLLSSPKSSSLAMCF
jgi:hypothetical protein